MYFVIMLIYQTSQCYWEVQTDLDFYVEEAMGMCSVILGGYILWMVVWVIRRRRKMGLRVVSIYMVLALWMSSHVGKIVFSLLCYACYLRNHDELVPSKLFCLLDSLPTVCLQGLLLFIPYIWLDNVVKFLQASKISLTKTSSFLGLLFFYQIVRVVIFVSLLGLNMLDFELCDAVNSIIIGEAFLCIIALFLVLKMLLNYFQLLCLNVERDRLQFKKDFTLLMLCCVVRFVLNLVFLVTPWVKTISSCIDSKGQSYLHSILYLAVGIAFTHLLPVTLILKIYNLNTYESIRSKISTEISTTSL